MNAFMQSTKMFLYVGLRGLSKALLDLAKHFCWSSVSSSITEPRTLTYRV